MEHRFEGKNEKGRKPLAFNKFFLAGAGILAALSVVAGIIWGQLFIPLGCIAILVGVLVFSMKLQFDTVTTDLAVKAVLAVMIVVGAVLLFKGLTAGFGRQDDLTYTESLGVTADELLATTGSEGARYAVIWDGVFSRRLLPEEYRAERAEDIGAVLILQTVHHKTGSYTNGGTAYQTNVKITLKSLKTGEELSTYTLYGGDAPSHVRTSPLDFNTDRYGAAPSDESIMNACVSLITRTAAEQARKSRVVLLSGEELTAFIRQKVGETAGADGWSKVNDVEEALKKADPDFTITDYGFGSLLLFFRADSRFALKERDTSDIIYYISSSDYVRWAGN